MDKLTGGGSPRNIQNTDSPVSAPAAGIFAGHTVTPAKAKDGLVARESRSSNHNLTVSFFDRVVNCFTESLDQETHSAKLHELHHGSAEERAQAIHLLLELVKTGHVRVEQIIEIASSALQRGSAEERVQAGNLLLGLAQIDNVSIDLRVKMASSVLLRGNPKIKKEAANLLLGLAQLEEVPVDLRLKIAGSVLQHGTPQTKVQAIHLLSELAQRDNAPLDRTINLVSSTFQNGSPEARVHVVNLFLYLAKIESGPTDQIIDVASAAFQNGNAEIKEQATKLLLVLAQLDNAPVAQIIQTGITAFENGNAQTKEQAVKFLLDLAQIEKLPDNERITIATRALLYGSAESKEYSAKLLLRLALIETLSVNKRVEAAGPVLRYGSSEAKKQAAKLFLELARMQDAPVDQIIKEIVYAFQNGNAETKALVGSTFPELLNRVIEKQGVMKADQKVMIVDVLRNLIRNRPLDALNENVLSYFAHHVLRDPMLAQDRDLLLRVSQTVLEGLNEDDERYQSALSVSLQLQDPASRNAYTVYQNASSKREVLKSVDLLNANLPTAQEGGISYGLVPASIQRVLPVPEFASMPHATRDTLIELGHHLREAVQHCSKAQKAMLLGIPDMDIVDDAEMNARMEDSINALLNSVLESNEIAAWMSPHREGFFNQTKYELQAVVKHAHDLLVAWREKGGVFGEELPPAAASFFQLLVNITSCPSGQRAGIHTAFVETPGLHHPMSEDALIESLPAEIKGFMKSREEADLHVRPKVLAFIQDANEFYYNFRMQLLDGDGPFLKALIGKDSQPSHQRDYAYQVLGECLGLIRLEEIIPIDLHGQVVHPNLENLSAEALLNAYLNTQFDGGRNFTEALVDKFHAHWSAKIEAGLNNPNASKAEKEAYNDFVKVLSAAGIDATTCLNTIEDDEGNDTFILKKSVVPEILCALGILKRTV